MSSGYFPAAQIGAEVGQGSGNVLQNFAQILQIKNAQQQSEMIGQQIQGAQLENQQRQLQLNQTQALNEAFRNAYMADPTTGNPVFNEAGIYKQLADKGAGSLIPQIRESFLKMNTQAADLQEKQNAVQSAHRDYLATSLFAIQQSKDPQGHYDPTVVGGAIAHYAQVDPQGAANMQKQLLGLNPDARDRMIDSLIKSSPQVQQMATEQAQQQKAQAESQKEQAIADWYKAHPEAGAPGVPAESAALAAYQKVHPGATMLDYKAAQEKANAAATQPYKIQTAQVEAQTRMAMEGMAKPVYAYNPKTDTTRLMNQTEAVAQGLVPRPVSGKEVQDDVMLQNRLADVKQKLDAYEQSLKLPVSPTEKSDMAGMLGEGAKGGAGAKIGFLGAAAQIPMDRLNAFMDSASLGELGANARDQLIAYRNMREALVGYKTVLSGSARGSDKTMELLDQAIPHPAVTDRDYSQRSLNAFRQNLQIVGRGMPQIPGVTPSGNFGSQKPTAPNIPRSISDLMNQFNQR